mgnify:CR=1 FL=1|tara:strand:+ start:174 stop:464 length:291 start_codon:yes stop_codon:yes gene_type:complete
MKNKRYVLSTGFTCDTNMHIIINDNAYKKESEVIAEFNDFDMCTQFINNLFIPFTNKKGEYKYSTYKNEKKRSWTSDGYKQQTNRNKTKQIDKRKK